MNVFDYLTLANGLQIHTSNKIKCKNCGGLYSRIDGLAR